MKIQAAIALMSLLFATFGCSKTSTPTITSFENSKNSSNEVVTAEVQSSDILKMVNENSESKRLQLLLNNSLGSINQQTLEQILDLHSKSKIDTYEFRTLFWKASISNQSIELANNKIINDENITNLDKKLIQSIQSNNISISELIEEFVNDKETTLPASMQSKLIAEILRIFEDNPNDYRSNSMIVTNFVMFDTDETKIPLLKKIMNITDLVTLKHKLLSKRLVSPLNLNVVSPRQITFNNTLNYSYSLGRGGTHSKSLNFANYEGNVGSQFNSETPSVANLNIYSKETDTGSGTAFEILVNSSVQGGYDRDHKEDATAILNYDLNGTIVVPKCLNPAYCDQIISVISTNGTRDFTNSQKDNSGTSITINGNYFENKYNNKISIDISTQDAVIQINFRGSKKHVGACCTNQASAQKISLKIGNGLEVSSFNTLNEIPTYDFITKKYMTSSNSYHETINSLPKEVEDLKKEILRVINDNSRLEDYRILFYNKLEFVQLELDQLLLENASPIEILYRKELRSSISDVIGRGLLYPLIISKSYAYQLSSISYSQQIINETYKSLLLLNLGNEDIRENAQKIIESKLYNLNSETRETAVKLVDAINNTNLTHLSLLNELANAQAEFSFLTLKMTIEMDVLNLEKAQFSEVNESGAVVK